MKRLWIIFALLGSSFGQKWSGILNSGRAVSWESTAGIPGGIPVYTTACTTAQAGTTVPIPSSVTSASAIATALANCSSANPGGSYLSLGSGTFTLSGTLIFGAISNVSLRGAGPLATIIKWSGGTSNCNEGQNCGISIGPLTVYENSASVQPGNTNSLDLTGTVESGVGNYSWGDTHITVTNVGSNKPQVGYLLILDQLNDTSTGHAVPAGIVQGDDTTVTGGTSLSGNGSSFGRCPNVCTTALRRSQAQVTRIVACTPNCSSPTGYTISPGILFNNMRQAQSPGAWWSTTFSSSVGLENLTVDDSNNVGQGVMFMNSYQAWSNNVRVLCTGACVLRSHYAIGQSLQGMVRSGYIFGSRAGGESYGIEPTGQESGFVFENTILHQVVAATINDSPTGFVYDYNYGVNWNPSSSTFLQCAYFSHDAGAAMNLYEGNIFPCMVNDNQHGNSPLATAFRNYVPGNEPVPFNKTGSGSQTISFIIDSYSRADSFVGNVLGILTCSGGTNNGLPANRSSQCPGGTLTGASYATQYECSTAAGCSNGGGSKNIFVLGYGDGYQANNSGGGNPGPTTAAAGNDAEVLSSLMRWGNSDSATGTTRWNCAEVPTAGGTFYSATTCPASHTLPASFYYTATPSWWSGAFGTPPWPPIGPDVTGGDLVTSPSGLAYRNLAQLCFDNLGLDSTNYPTTSIKAFDAATCYPTGAPAPIVQLSPTSLTYASRNIGTTSAPQSTTLTNVGSATLNISSITLQNGSQFAISGNTCGATLTVSANCVVSVTFTPTGSGLQTDSILFNTDAATSPDDVPLSGTGIQPTPTGSFGKAQNGAVLSSTPQVGSTLTVK